MKQHRCCPLIASAALLALAVGCATPQRQGAVRPDFQVSVSAGGAPVTDLNTDYIHRIDYSAGAASKLSALPRTVERDRQGRVMGFRIGDGAETTLGLKGGDLITAIGPQRITQKKQFDELLRAVKDREDVTLTIVRRGAPHKVYLYPELSSNQ